MKHQRTEFTEIQKAQIYARDRATCSFSGKSLWILDYGVAPTWQIDWVDHVVPSSRGGKAEISNGVCASYVFNSKKKNNGSDNVYFFEEGRPTYDYYRFFGKLTPDLDNQLKRLAALDSADWFFNRAIFNAFLGFDYRCQVERFDHKPKRTDKYWFSAAWRRMQKYRSILQVQKLRSVEDRGLVLRQSQDVKSLLDLRNSESESDLFKKLDKIYPLYRTNYNFFEDFWWAESVAKKERIIVAAEKNSKTSQIVLEMLNSHLLSP